MTTTKTLPTASARPATKPPLLRVELVLASNIVVALEAAGHRDAADIARNVAGMPPHVPTADEQFVDAVRTLVTGGAPVGFNCDDADECERRWVLVRTMPAMSGGRRYKARVCEGSNTRLEVSLG